MWIGNLSTALLLGSFALAIVVWTTLAILYTAPLPRPGRRVLAAGYPVTLAATAGATGQVLPAAVVAGAAFALALVRFFSIRPRSAAAWCPDVAVLPRAEILGDRVVVRDLRHFAYRATEHDREPRRVDRPFDLARIRHLDLVVSYWNRNTAIAHTMLSWDFGGDDVLCLSIEVRRKAGDAWGALPGLFRQFEIIYVLGDERDLVRLRAAYRGEEVYLFRTEATPAAARALLERVLRHVNSLHERPELYHTIGRNCTTALVGHINAIWPQRIPFTRRILMNGYAPEQAYECGLLCTDLPFAEYRRASRIDGVARAAGDGEGFSRRIRVGLPKCGG